MFPAPLTIGEQKFTLSETESKSDPIEGKFIKIQEVGYWLRSGKLLLNLADAQVERSMVLLEINTVEEEAKPDVRFEGISFIETYDPGISRKFEISCSWSG